MNDEDLLRDVVSLAREKETRRQAQQAEPLPADQRTQEIFAPLGEDFRAEMTRRLLAEAGRRQDDSQDARVIAMPTAKETVVDEPGQVSDEAEDDPMPAASRHRWINWGLAAAASVTLGVGLWHFVAPPMITETDETQAYSPSPVGSSVREFHLPKYELSVGGVDQSRGATANEAYLRLVEGYQFGLSLTPTEEVSGPVELAAFLVAPGRLPRRWPIDEYLERAPSGAFLLSGILTAELVPESEERTLLLVVGRRQAMQDRDYLAEALEKPAPTQDWRIVEVSVEVQEP